MVIGLVWLFSGRWSSFRGNGESVFGIIRHVIDSGSNKDKFFSLLTSHCSSGTVITNTFEMIVEFGS